MALLQGLRIIRAHHVYGNLFHTDESLPFLYRHLGSFQTLPYYMLKQIIKNARMFDMLLCVTFEWNVINSSARGGFTMIAEGTTSASAVMLYIAALAAHIV